MRKCVVNLLSAIAILLAVASIGYGLVLVSSLKNYTPFFPSLDGGGSGPPAVSSDDGGGGADGRASPEPRWSGAGIGGRRGALPGSSPEAPGKKKPGTEGGGAGTAAAPAPPCPPCESVEQKMTKKTMLLLGCFMSVLSFSNPVITYWSLSSNLQDTITFHSLWDLIATTASSLAWLLFAITQLHTEDGGIIGVATVVVNVAGVAVYTLCTIIKMAGQAGEANVGIKGCVGAIAVLCAPIFIAIYFVVFGPIHRDSSAAMWISYGAALVQLISQFLPFRSFCLLCCPEADGPAQHANTKNLIIYSRGCNLIICLYWAMYCVFTYQHSFFEAANVLSAVLALITFALHLGYALKPPDPVVAPVVAGPEAEG